jgi:transcriptional regulator with XRE-family HTH domain
MARWNCCCSTRRDRGRDAEDIAQRVGIGVESLRAIERGERPLVDEDPANIARWVLSLDVSRDVLAPALRTSIGTPAGTGAYGVRREARVSEDQERFVQEVLRAFDEASTKRS